MWCSLWSILVYRFERPIILLQKVNTLRLLKIHVKFCLILCIIRVWSLFCSVRFLIGLYFLPIFFGKLGFYLSVFWFFMFPYLWFLAFIFLCYVLSLMLFLIKSDLIMFFNLLLTLLGPFFSNLGDLSESQACLLPENSKTNHEKYTLCWHFRYVSFL